MLEKTAYQDLNRQIADRCKRVKVIEVNGRDTDTLVSTRGRVVSPSREVRRAIIFSWYNRVGKSNRSQFCRRSPGIIARR